tara:strand:- start:148 stop:588 length:441 start_codon:yes stop_codon:yes gene_type:complete
MDSNKDNLKNQGIIGKYKEDGLSVIVSFENTLPSQEIISKLPVLAVVSWKYDGSKNNGMPDEETNSQMMALEDALEDQLDKSSIYKRAYSRTGNSLKEFLYYTKSQEEFMALLNNQLRGHQPYPIEINLYRDPEWEELKKLLQDFN